MTLFRAMLPYRNLLAKTIGGEIKIPVSILKKKLPERGLNFLKFNAVGQISVSGLSRQQPILGITIASNLKFIDLPRTQFLPSLLSDAKKFSNRSTEKDEGKSNAKTVAVQEDDPFDTITDRIPEKPVTVAEAGSYSIVIIAGLAVAAFAAYAVVKELLLEPKEYTVFNKALDRVKLESQVLARIGNPITGYGQESRNRAARQRITNKVWKDEDGVERIQVQFHIRGPRGAGIVHCEMFKDREDRGRFKFTYLVVDITHPSPVRLMLESYVPQVSIA